MKPEITNQINRINMLSEMVKEKLADYENDIKEYDKWENEQKDGKHGWYLRSNLTNPTEIKRLMLVYRQEMIALGKLL